ncbi:hypothetical protein E2562_036101 [Oryza meyeriana var. granulata]|uniref:Uncharacterized protein n=1 Tax=Oryza meyeriana var. granulata TaxID=110450 RepID=A0A6G1DUR2_9ORYZ|nr:hypothetical protein E2562_036101 [Oryza meyeriana var. granulata]
MAAVGRESRDQGAAAILFTKGKNRRRLGRSASRFISMANSNTALKDVTVGQQNCKAQEVLLWGKYGESFDEDAALKKSKERIVVGIFAGLTATKFSVFQEQRSTPTSSSYNIYKLPKLNYKEKH